MSVTEKKILSGGKSECEKETIGLGEFYFRQAKKYGDRILQIEAISNKEETYKSANIKAVRLALNLIKNGITESDIIVSCLSNRLESLIPHLATLYVGAKICALDTSQSEREYSYCLGLVQPKFIFLEEKCVKTMEKALDTLPVKPVLVVIGESEEHRTFKEFQNEMSGENEFTPVVCQNCHECAIIFFSSGTTGLSKAVCLSHYGLLNGTKVFTELDHFDAKVVLSYATMYWISSMLLWTIVYHTGGSRIMPETFEPRKLLKTIEKYKVSYLSVSSMMIHSILEVIHQESYDFSSLYSVTFAGGVVPPEKLQNIRKFLGTERVTTGYGITEGGMTSILFDYTKDKERLDKFGSSGRCVPDTEVKIVDINTNQLQGTNEKGELLIKSPYLSIGYYNIDSSFAFDQDGFFKTGDIAYYDDEEFVYIVDRIKEVFKYKGYAILPSFLESILLEHPAVKEAAVFGMPHDEDRNWPAAYVTLKKGYSITEQEIETFYSERVSDYHKLRAGIKILEEFEKTPSGKLQKNLLKDKFLAQKKS